MNIIKNVITIIILKNMSVIRAKTIFIRKISMNLRIIKLLIIIRIAIKIDRLKIIGKLTEKILKTRKFKTLIFLKSLIIMKIMI